jgi:predicted dehydrogenase
MSEKLGVLVIGTGWAGEEHISAFHANPHTEIRGLCNRTPEKAARIRDRYGLDCQVSADHEAMIRSPDVDIVSVCSVHSAHFDQARAALEAGKHVLVEKPLCLTLEHARVLRDLTIKTRLKTAVGFVARWYSAIRKLRGMVADGAIGDPYHIECHYLHEVKAGWKSTAETAGTSLLTGGVHAVDTMRYFQRPGVEAREVFAYTLPARRRPDFTYDPTVSLMVRFENGCIGCVGSSLEANMPYVFHLQVLGTEGVVRGPAICSEKLNGGRKFIAVEGDYPDSPLVSHHPFGEEIDYFVDCILNDIEPMVSIPDACKTHEIVFGAELSAKKGQPVALPLAG